MVFILGGNGFVGSAIVRYCIGSGIGHRVITRENYADLQNIPCTIFINANGNSKKFLAEDQPLVEFDASVRSVRSSLVDFKFERYVHLSSCDVYPDCSSPSSTLEDMDVDVTQQSHYGFHKYLAELCVRHSARHWLIIRMGGFVGLGMKKNPIFDILNGRPLWLDPASELQYMHTDTFSNILFDLINRNVNNQVINVCGQGTISLKEVIDCTGAKVITMPSCPLVRYEASVERLSSMVSVPVSRSAVLEFVTAQLSLRS